MFFLKDHLHSLVIKIMIYLICNLSKFFTEEDFYCGSDEFPFVLVPLTNDSQDAQLAAKECIERLYTLCSRVVFLSF